MTQLSSLSSLNIFNILNSLYLLDGVVYVCAGRPKFGVSRQYWTWTLTSLRAARAVAVICLIIPLFGDLSNQYLCWPLPSIHNIRRNGLQICQVHVTCECISIVSRRNWFFPEFSRFSRRFNKNWNAHRIWSCSAPTCACLLCLRLHEHTSKYNHGCFALAATRTHIK